MGITANEGGRGDGNEEEEARKLVSQSKKSRGSESAESARRSLSPEKKTLKKQKQTKTPRLAGLFAPAAPSISRGYFRPFLTVQFATRRGDRGDFEGCRDGLGEIPVRPVRARARENAATTRCRGGSGPGAGSARSRARNPAEKRRAISLVRAESRLKR